MEAEDRLAVVVDWVDSAGRHQVSQQSSLRAPDAAAIVGLTPPGFSSAFPPTANPSQAWVDVNGEAHGVHPDESFQVHDLLGDAACPDVAMRNRKHGRIEAIVGLGWLGVIYGPDAAGRMPGELFEDHVVVVAVDFPVIEPQVGQLARRHFGEGGTEGGNSDAWPCVAKELDDAQAYLEGGLFPGAATGLTGPL